MQRLTFRCLVGAAFITLSGPPLFPSTAYAADPSQMSCEDLWYNRHELYAEAGQCFKTGMEKAVYGENCFAPYGKLAGWEKEYAETLQMWEKRKGC